MREEYDFSRGKRGKHAGKRLRIVGDTGPSRRDTIREALALIFQGIKRLTDEFPNRAFTIDGRLVGDIGEVIAALEYDILLDHVGQAVHDGTTSDGRRVQVKATFKDHLTFKLILDIIWASSCIPMVDTKKCSMARVKLSMTDTFVERTSAFVSYHFQYPNFVCSPMDCSLINEYQNVLSKTKTR